jgi:cytidine deaminase
MNLLEKAFALAKEVRLKAHAPYSNFKVGTALKVKGQDQFVTACNVENANYCGGSCSEKNAFMQMVSLFGKVEPEFLVLVADTPNGSTPCGDCRQVMSEFCSPDFPIHIANLQGIQKKYLMKDLLPAVFDKKDLNR